MNQVMSKRTGSTILVWMLLTVPVSAATEEFEGPALLVAADVLLPDILKGPHQGPSGGM